MRILGHNHRLIVDGLVLQGVFVYWLGPASVDDVVDLVDDGVEAGHIIEDARASAGVLFVLYVEELAVAYSVLMELDMRLKMVG